MKFVHQREHLNEDDMIFEREPVPGFYVKQLAGVGIGGGPRKLVPHGFSTRRGC